MITEAGHFALILALVLALVQSILPLAGSYKNNTVWMETSKHTSSSIALLLTLAMASLINAFAQSDFSVLLVVEHSHSLKPLIYKISAVWGNHEGSMLLWSWILAVYGLIASCTLKHLPPEFRARTLAVQGIILLLFLSFTIFTSNPFLRLENPPADGQDLNPLLQDIGLALHPPMLYLGYVGFSIVFSIAAARMMGVTPARLLAKALKPFVLASWSLLGAGITLGSLWAYYELGWGGFWFWDPVENASLMPWLAGLALLHAVSIAEKRGQLESVMLLLSVLAFAFSLTGTFLVRSGILTSVHAFAVDPARGVYILMILFILIGGALGLFAFRKVNSNDAPFSPVSREGFVVINTILISSALLTVFAGTFYPVIIELLNMGTISVGAPYFNKALFPLVVLMAVLMGLGGYARHTRDTVAGIIARGGFAVFMTALFIIVLVREGAITDLTVFAGATMGAWVIVASAHDFLARIRAGAKISTLVKNYGGMTLAHAGFGIFLIGVTATAQLREEVISFATEGQRFTLGGYELQFLGVTPGLGKNYNTDEATFILHRGMNDYRFLNPERRWYPASEKETSEVALDVTFTDIIYAVLGEENADKPGTYAIRLYRHPLAIFIWGGGFLMAAGGAVAFLTSRRRA